MKYFAWSPKELKDMFSNDIPQGKYMSEPEIFPDEEFMGCMKPMEYFLNDIAKNLTAWSKAPDNSAVYYKTKNNCYKIAISLHHSDLIDIFCHNKSVKKTLSTWINKSTMDVGKDFLKDKKDLFVPLLP